MFFFAAAAAAAFPNVINRSEKPSGAWTSLRATGKGGRKEGRIRQIDAAKELELDRDMVNICVSHFWPSGWLNRVNLALSSYLYTSASL